MEGRRDGWREGGTVREKEGQLEGGKNGWREEGTVGGKVGRADVEKEEAKYM